MNKKAEKGSITAKGGFVNEHDICNKFTNWKIDEDAKSWLEIMGYKVNKIQKINAVQIPPKISFHKALDLGITEEKFKETIKYKKADIQVRVEILIDDILYIENISLKKANKTAGFNQVDKRTVNTYQSMWKFDDTIALWLKAFTGEIFLPEVVTNIENLKDKKRIYFTNMPNNIQIKIKDFFTENKFLVLSDILRGRGGLSAEWFLVTRKNTNNTDYILKNINQVLNFYGNGDVIISPRGSLKIGRVTMQRKGGTPDPTSLQFKINPLSLFAI